MRHYTADEESRIRRQALVRSWARARLLEPYQMTALEDQLRTDLKRTNTMLRLALAGFTAIVAAASIGLIAVTFRIHSDAAVAALLVFSALACFGAADYLAGTIRLYRYGVEEMLAIMSPVLLAFAVLSFVNGHAGRGLDAVTALVVCAAGAFVVYKRFGFVYAAVLAALCAAAIPFQFELAEPAQRLCAGATLGALLFIARALYLQHGEEFPGDDYSLLQAAACAGVYLLVNLRISDLLGRTILTRPTAADAYGWYYWATYLATWLIPAAAVVAALRDRDRRLLVVGMSITLVTLATNKPYLGIARQPWDPMILGVLLVGFAIGLRRWLASGPGGARNGYTAERILDSDTDLLTTAANASVAWHGHIHERPPADATPPTFSGGRSGGAGGGASF